MIKSLFVLEKLGLLQNILICLIIIINIETHTLINLLSFKIHFCEK